MTGRSGIGKEQARGGADAAIPHAAMLLAAGEGRRMRPLTQRLPKPLLPLAGRPLIDHALQRLQAAGVRRVVVNLHHLGDQIRAHLAGRSAPEIVFSDESALLLDTGGGVLQALPWLGAEPFFAVNGDAFWTEGAVPALRRLAECFDAAAMDALLLLQPLETAVGYDGPGDFARDADGRLRRRAPQGTAPFVFTGVQMLRPRALVGAPAGPFSLNWLYDRAAAAGRLYGLAHDGLWMCLNTPAALALAEARLAREAAP